MAPCVHFIGFRDDRYIAAVKVWGRPDFIHRWYDTRARQEIDYGADTIVFASGEADQPMVRRIAPGLIDDDPAEKERME